MPSEIKKIIGFAGDVTFKTMEASLTDTFKENFTNYKDGLVKGDPGGFVLTPEYARNAEELRKFQPRKDDVWILSFPKCGKTSLLINPGDGFKSTVFYVNTGTTWTQEMVWMIMNDCNQEAAKKPLIFRSPFLE